MPLIRLLSLIFALFLIIPGAVVAGDAETDYQKARESYRRLLGSTKKQLYRENWERVIDRFLAVKETYPRNDLAPSGLYMAGKACRGLYGVSRIAPDARRAAGLFDAVADTYPASSLADDALVLAGEIYQETLKEPRQAYLRFARAADRFPEGDMAGKALKKKKELARYAPPAPAAPKQAGRLRGVRFWSNPGYTRVVLDLSQEANYSSNVLPAKPERGDPPKIFLDLHGIAPGEALPQAMSVDDGLLRRIRTGQPERGTVRVVLDLVSMNDYKVFPLQDPYRLVIDIGGEGQRQAQATHPEISYPPPSSDGIDRILDQSPRERPLKIKLPATQSHGGLRRIVVDAGHGGKDPGAVGPSGTYEKDVTLALAKELAKRLEKEFGCEVILTRDRDVFLPLEERTAIANKVDADLFISVHANANRNRKAYGVETFYLNFSKNDKAAAVAARENGTSLKQVGDLELILFDLMANAKINESSRLASEIQRALVNDLGKEYKEIRDLGVKQGPFYVLLGATMPSVLVEAAFISNKREEKRLTDRRFQQKTGSAIVRGIRNYATALKLIAAK